MQLREKQKIRRLYSVLERQFHGYFEEAASTPGVTGENLLRMLELRMDNVVYRMGFAASRAEARQLVGHAHFNVNGRVASIPSMRLKPGDKVEVRETHRSRGPFKEVADLIVSREIPDWLNVDATKLAGSVVSTPRRDQMPLDLNEQLVVEYYSR
jgi:small subunit ribosomal protein S4